MKKIVCKDRECIHNENSTDGCASDKKVIIILKGKCYAYAKEKSKS